MERLQPLTASRDRVPGHQVGMETVDRATSTCGDQCLRLVVPHPYPNKSLSQTYVGFPDSSALNNLLATQERQVRSLNWEDPLEKKMATHSNILAWEIPWTEKPDKLESMGLQESDTT